MGKNPFFFPSPSPLSPLGRRSPPAAHLARPPLLPRPPRAFPSRGPARRLRPSLASFSPPLLLSRFWAGSAPAAQPLSFSRPAKASSPWAAWLARGPAAQRLARPLRLRARGTAAQPPPPLRVGPVCKSVVAPCSSPPSHDPAFFSLSLSQIAHPNPLPLARNRRRR
jgi:hypothetical protein